MININQKLATIQTKFKAHKSKFNNFGKYNYRSAEDILEAVKPYLLELGVTVVINEELTELNSGLPVLKSTATISDGDNSIDAIAIVGVDLGQKGMNVPQQFGSASSYAKKYALGNLLLIDDTQDSDATNDHGKSDIVYKSKTTVTKDRQPLTKSSDNFKKAKDYIKSGGTIETIKTKYDVSADVEKALLT